METITKRNCAKQSLVQRLIILVVLPLVLILGTAGCEGPSGTQGPEGPQGPKGQQGPVGPAGEDGSIIHAGQGAPASDLGEVDDYYLNRNTGELYGPKQNNGWGTPISLQGPKGEQGDQGLQGSQGPKGDDGSQIYSGSGAPGASLGVEGDYYLDKDNFELYGPKTGSGWSTPLNLKGTANVMYSSWSNLDSAVRDTTIDGSNMQAGDINAPQISQEILDKGVVNVYMKFSDDVYPLPYTSYAGGTANVVDFLPRLNKLLITRFAMDNSGSIGFATSLEYRYVIIPGGVAVKSKRSEEQLRNMSYEEVTRYFGIRD